MGQLRFGLINNYYCIIKNIYLDIFAKLNRHRILNIQINKVLPLMFKSKILTILYTLCLLTLGTNIYAGDTGAKEVKAKAEPKSTAENNTEDTIKKENESAEKNVIKAETEENPDNSDDSSPKESEEDEEPDCD